jgi:hypothetical protein
VRLVAHPLHELQDRRVARQRDRFRPSGDDDQLLPLGQARDGLLAEAQLFEGASAEPAPTARGLNFWPEPSQWTFSFVPPARGG